MSENTVATEVIQTLRDLGVKHVFGVPSGGWVDYMEALRITEGIEFVLATHEGGAGFMADVAGRLSGAPGVCFGTFGPGATNLATGVGSALLDRSPVLALTDEMPVAMRGRTTQMGIDHQALFAPLTKTTLRLSARNPGQTIIEAAGLSQAERPGPVHIGLPLGLSSVQAQVTAAEPGGPAPIPHPEAGELGQCAVMLAASKKPLVVLGLGAVRARVAEEALTLARHLQAPVVLTPMAKGMIGEDDPLYAGVLFHALSDVVAETHGQADLVIAVGYDPVEFNFEQWMPTVPLINLDTRAVDIDRQTYPEVLDITGCIRESLDYITTMELAPGCWDLAALAERRRGMFGRMQPQAQSFGPCAALTVLRECLPVDGVMVCDVGAHTHLIGQLWRTPAPGLQIMTNGWSAMGFAIPAAIAAKLIRPELPLCAVVGDGGFLMTAGELAVAVRMQLDIVFVVLTDNDLALIRIKQEKKSNPIYGTPIRPGGTIGGDNIFGVPVIRACDVQAYRGALNKAMAMAGPVIVEAMVSSREYDALVLRDNRL
jgi:acetolactate synthase-1/2/3 large subunit